MKHKLLKLIAIATLALSISASCFAEELDNVRFGDNFDKMDEMPSTESVDIITLPFPYDTLIKFNPDNVLNTKAEGIEYNFYQKGLYRVTVIFAENTEADFQKLSDQLTKKYGKYADTGFSGKTFKALGRDWAYKGNHYALNYYHYNESNVNSLTLVIKTAYYIPDEKERGYSYIKPRTPKSYDDLKIFK